MQPLMHWIMKCTVFLCMMRVCTTSALVPLVLQSVGKNAIVAGTMCTVASLLVLLALLCCLFGICRRKVGVVLVRYTLPEETYPCESGLECKKHDRIVDI
jgi:hypothetical protein